MKKKNKTQPFTNLTDEAAATITGGHFFDIFHQWHHSIERQSFEGLQPHFRSYSYHYHSDGNGSGIIIDQYSSFNIIIH
ncbi:hypothetical protein [Lusitaniella coriacea]|uniref:hypothetical protein n=1 Tax=Lusitaniella coriacea TaxID=1983105 RepID=UPI003CE69E2C